MFCLSCGSFIAVGSKARTPPTALPFSGPPPVPGDADADVSLPFIDGVSPLGSYTAEAHRRATRRTRTLTAVTSVALAMVIAGAALYLASPLSDRSEQPQTAAAVSSTTVPEPTDETGAVSGISVEPEAATGVEVGASADLEPVVEPLPVIEQPEPVQEPEVEPAQPEPIVEPEPAGPDPVPDLDQPEPVAQPVIASEPESEPAIESVAAPVEPARPALRPGQDAPAAYYGGWVCDREVVIEDSRVRDWSLGRVSFRVRPDFERVVLHLERAGQGSGDPASITAEAVPSTRVRSILPGVSKPGAGRSTIGLRLDNGFSGNLALRSYQPSGLNTIKEFSVYPAGRDGRNVLISTASDGCFRVRVPAWNDASNSVRRAEIHIDVTS